MLGDLSDKFFLQFILKFQIHSVEEKNDPNQSFLISLELRIVFQF